MVILYNKMAVVKKANDFLYALKGEDGQNIITEMRKEDGFINATKLCKSAGKYWADYIKTKRTSSFLKELSSNMNIIIEDLIVSSIGGDHAGTWVHPNVAINLAAWCSPKFEVAVSNLVLRYLSGKISTEESRQVSKRFIESGIQLTDYDMKQVIYLGEVDTPQFKGIKAGYTDNIIRRLKEHTRDFGSFKLVKLFEALNNREIEQKILKECQARGVKTSCKINDKMQTELITLNDEFTFDELVILIDSVMNSNVPSEIQTKDKEIKEKDKALEEKEKLIEVLKSSNDLQIEKEITKQLELQIELEKLKKEEQEKVRISKQELEHCHQEAEDARKRELQKQDDMNRLTMNYQEQIKKIEEELVRLKLEEENAIDPNEEMKKYVEKYCEFGVDCRKNTERYRIPCDDLYKHYSEKVRLPMVLGEFKKYIQENHNVELRKCNWLYEIKTTCFGIRLKDFVFKKVSLVVKLINEFVDEECLMDTESVVDTKVLYQNFAKFSKDKGFDTIKQNGFTPQLFRSNLLQLQPSVTIKEWAINGKKHGFSGIKLKNSVPQDHELVEEFVKECCFKGLGYRTKRHDLYIAFSDYIAEKYKEERSSMMFCRIFREQNQDLVEKCITKSDIGFVGIVLRSVLKGETIA
jgi:hypothetical protein